jgi:hypothetical protein
MMSQLTAMATQLAAILSVHYLQRFYLEEPTHSTTMTTNIFLARAGTIRYFSYAYPNWTRPYSWPNSIAPRQQNIVDLKS